VAAVHPPRRTIPFTPPANRSPTSRCPSSTAPPPAPYDGHHPARSQSHQPTRARTLDGPDDVAGSEPLVTLKGGLAAGRLGAALTLDGVNDLAATRHWGADLSHHHFLLGRRLGKLKDSPSDPDYCHAITDTDLWIVSGLVELLAARALDPSIATLAPGERDAIAAYLDLALALVESRLVDTKLDGGKLTGAVFDPGIWNTHPDHEYAGYTGANFPTVKDKAAAPLNGWDLSHARRFVHVFDSLHRHRAITGRLFPSEQTLVKLATQFAWASWNRDLARPLFRNFRRRRERLVPRELQRPRRVRLPAVGRVGGGAHRRLRVLEAPPARARRRRRGAVADGDLQGPGRGRAPRGELRALLEQLPARRRHERRPRQSYDLLQFLPVFAR
jgi:hypothetical protein